MASPLGSRDSKPLGSVATFLALGAFIIAAIALVAVGTDSGGGGGDSGSSDSAPTNASVTLTEFKINPAAIVVDEGGQIDIKNAGTVAHNFQIVGQDLQTPDIQPGASATLDTSKLAAGAYDVICTIAGHADSGMKATLTVSSGAAGDGHANDVTAAATSGTAAADELDNAAMEKSMDAGVAKFLEFAGKYAEGKMKAGNPIMKPKILADGTKQFDLVAAVTDWQVEPGKIVKAWTYNGVVPGPFIKVNPNDKVKVVIKNELPISTDIHWHGIDVPNDQDGVAGLTQDYIRPGTSYTYEFTVGPEPQLAMYHAHNHGNIAVVNGLFAAIEVGSTPLPAGKTVAGVAIPADLNAADIPEYPMVLNDAGVIGLSLNGKSFPETAPVAAKVGDWFLVHYYNEGLLGHPMHLHRQEQIVVARDGFPLESPYRADTMWVGPGERVSVLVKAVAPGKWAWHCHILNHAESIKGLTGMVTVLVVE